jgi:hypothetical protein
MWNRSLFAAAGLLFGLAALVLLRAQQPTSAQDGAPPWTMSPLQSPAGANSSEPQFTQQGERVILSWLEVSGERATLKFAERTSSGWSAPRTVFSGANFFVNSFDVPSVRALADGTLVANWSEKNGDNEDASAVRLSWSSDQGRTWSRPVSPHHDGTQTEHGFVSLFQAPGAGLGLVWLDGRATDPEAETGDMSLRASVYDAAGKQLREMNVDSRVCDCCSTSVAQTPEGVIVAYRDRSPAEIRDISVTRFNGTAWSAPVTVHNDGWKIEACPINGPAVSAVGKNVAVAWFTAKDDKGRAFVAFSRDTGRTFGAPVRVDDASSLGRLGVEMLQDGSAVVTWMEMVNGHSQFRARKVTANGVRSAPVTVSQNVDSRSPKFTGNQRELLFAWTEVSGDSSRVRTARASLGSK